MDKQSYLIDLINRMNDKTTVFDSEFNGYVPRISEQAYAEASNLADKELIAPLKKLISTHASNKAADKDIRKKAYSILNKIAKNTYEMEIYKYFEERLMTETDKYIVSDYLLPSISQSDYIPSLHTILPLVDNNYWSTRHEAIALLGKFPKEVVEDKLLSLLNVNADEYEIGHVLTALTNIGSEKVIAQLDPFLHHGKGEVRASAMFTLGVVGGKQYLQTYKEGLKDRSPAVKFNALLALIQHGDEKDVPVLLDRLNAILKRKRRYEPGNLESSEVVKIIEFLLKYKGQEIIDILESFYQDKREFLFDLELEWLQGELLVLRQ